MAFSTDAEPSLSHFEHECLASEGGEADLHKHMKGCEKNPGHENFIPVKKFTVRHLPDNHRHEDLCEWIKATADLTVRVDVKMTSPNRPQFWPGEHITYPFYEHRGKTILRYGSGEMDIYEYEDGCGKDGHGFTEAAGISYKREYPTCPCEECSQSDKPKSKWWEALLTTAAHVVYDDIEAKHTTCKLFYDETDSDVQVFKKFEVCYINVAFDTCVLKYATCDANIGKKLYKMAERRAELLENMKRLYANKSDDSLNFIASYPHGCTKQISVGRCVSNIKTSDYFLSASYYYSKMTYTTSTCPGSSGAWVHCVGYPSAHVHRGTVDKRINCSSVGLYYAKESSDKK